MRYLHATLATAWVAGLMLMSCTQKHTINQRLDNEMPKKILWAWERPEDLTFADPNEYGVAFLAQTIDLERDQVTPNRRRQPLDTAAGAYVIAVTRIETNKEMSKRPAMTGETVAKVTSLIRSTLELPNVRAVQIDFDAVSSERNFYRSLITAVRKALPEAMPLTMTSLASWCTGDAWFNDFPVDEAVPMAFRMGADDPKVRTYLKNSNDWLEPLCRGSYGISIDDPPLEGLKPERRMYFFSNASWKATDLNRLGH
jgi:hypothetical protein